MVFFGIFELGSLLCGVATSSKMLIVGRAVAGLGTAGVFSGGLTIIAGTVAPEKRARRLSPETCMSCWPEKEMLTICNSLDGYHHRMRSARYRAWPSARRGFDPVRNLAVV